jgi:hypothetical protein
MMMKSSEVEGVSVSEVGAVLVFSVLPQAARNSNGAKR